MSLDDFAKCPRDGCAVHVFAPFRIPQRCLAHGGAELPQYELDIYGNPRKVSAADTSPAAPRRPLGAT